MPSLSALEAELRRAPSHWNTHILADLRTAWLTLEADGVPQTPDRLRAILGRGPGGWNASILSCLDDAFAAAAD
jgi:hypothetical protein